mmetsp:Transcript_15167/g.22712  ORF Transcript_15167/g.22712 Transcript_15167/m.22712 type:complete len:319 (-) Transcript_15167:6-962(-)
MPEIFKEKERERDIDRLVDKGVIKEEQVSHIQLRQVLAGALAGMITKTSIAPLERLKILFQLQGMEVKPGQTPKYNGIVNSLKTVVMEDGFRALWKGNGANVLRVVPVYALKFSVNDSFKEILRKEGQKELGTLGLMASGSMAGMFQTTVTYPLDLVRTRLSLAKGFNVHYNGIADCLTQTVRHEGFRGLYKGFGPTIASATPYVAFQMTFYELFKRQAIDESGNVSLPAKLACGAAAGLSAQTLTFPGDTIRRRMQIQGVGGRERQYTNTIDCCKKILANEGFRGFFKGCLTNAIRALPGAAIQFATYDTIKKILGV